MLPICGSLYWIWLLFDPFLALGTELRKAFSMRAQTFSAKDLAKNWVRSVTSFLFFFQQCKENLPTFMELLKHFANHDGQE